MKLKNKKTGEVREDSDLGKMLIRYAMPSYDSIAELCEEWEDYTSTEPLIKDEKIRKAVRAWAEANNLKNLAFEDYDDENVYFIDRDYEPQIWFPKKSILMNYLDDGKIYTITELCGEGDE